MRWGGQWWRTLCPENEDGQDGESVILWRVSAPVVIFSLLFSLNTATASSPKQSYSERSSWLRKTSDGRDWPVSAWSSLVQPPQISGDHRVIGESDRCDRWSTHSPIDSTSQLCYFMHPQIGPQPRAASSSNVGLLRSYVPAKYDDLICRQAAFTASCHHTGTLRASLPKLALLVF